VDYDTRIALRTKIDAATRRKVGLPARSATVARKPRGDASRKWSDDEIAASLERVAALEGVSLDELKLAAYRRRRAADPSIGLSVNALQPRLAAGILLCPRRLK
jgi:hypothetical protein